MKMNKYSILRWFIIAICALPLMSAGCEKNDDGDDYGSGSSLPSLAEFVEINITRCERVGSVLQIDYTMRNKKSNTLTVEIRSANVRDNNGTSYHSHSAFGDNIYSDFYPNITAKISGGSSVIGHVKVTNYDPNNKSKSIDLEIRVGIVAEQLGNDTYQRSDINVVDNRVLAHGIQSNDLNLQWTLNSCKRTPEGNVLIEFTVKNNTGGKLDDFSIGDGTGVYDTVYDNFGTRYYDWGIRFGSSGNYWKSANTNISTGGSANGSVLIEKFSSAATEVSVEMNIDIRDYVMNDNRIRFLTLPIQ